MNVENRTVLITGGLTGIGLSLASRFAESGSKIILVGSNEKSLAEARDGIPNVEIFACDLRNAGERERLCHWATRHHPSLDVLINCSSVQRRIGLKDDNYVWGLRHQEIAVNFEAPVHLTSLLLPHLFRQPEAEIINVSSGLAFTPYKSATVFCATMAAIHSFTASLRHELEGSRIKVIEIVPPDLDWFSETVFERLRAGEEEIAYGMIGAQHYPEQGASA